MRTRYAIGFGLAALILASVGVSIMLSTQRYRGDSQWVVHTYDVLRRVEQIHTALLEGIASQRSYLLTGNVDYRGEFERARPLIRQEIAGLLAVTRDNPQQDARIRSLGSLIDARLDSAAEGMRIYEQRGLEAARVYTQRNRGLDLMRQIEALIVSVSREESRLLGERTARSQNSATLLLASGAVGIPLSLGILLWIYVLLSREVRQRDRAEQQAKGFNDRLAESVAALSRTSDDLRELGQYAGLLQSCRNVPEALDVTRRTLAALFPHGAGGIYLLRASQDYAELETTWGEHTAKPHELMMPHECWATRRSQPHYLDDVAIGMACTHLDVPAQGVAATACLPLTAQGISLGLLYIAQPSAGPIPHIAVAVAAAEQLSLALNNLRLQESLRQQSIRDALSGLFNRRYLQESLPRELARATRRAQPLAVLMLDIDHFKAFNDSQGHDAGDAVIAEFGRLLQSLCREEDIPCRYGGEEFTLILPDTDEAAARRRAEEIRRAVELLVVRHLQRDVGRVTVSIGLAMSPLHGADAETLQKLADAALYRAKRAGRNRVELARVDSAGA